jgi:threonine dehydratase/serine racemase
MPGTDPRGPEPAAVLAAAVRIEGYVHRTPIMTSSTLDRIANAELFFKCENLQRIGAFKIRGALNAVLSLDDADAARGVACHSSGNHGQALALAARTRGIAAHVVMPVDASAVKRAAIEGYGAHIVDCEPTEASRNETVARVVAETGAVEIHPFDDDRIIAGQGTAALELLQDAPPLDAIVAPVGGGGLLSGTALAVGTDPDLTTAVYGAEPAAADDAQRSFRTGRLHPSDRPQTVADGLLTSLSPRTLTVIRARAADIVTVEEGAIIDAMRLLWERTKLLVEPSAAVGPAAVLAGLVPGRRIGVILSGGNVDLDRLPWVVGGAGGRPGS